MLLAYKPSAEPIERNMKIRGSAEKGLFVGKLARGCELCYPGVKAVIFVSGACDDACFYCPVGRERLYTDGMWVNEERVSSVEEAVLEVQRMGAKGASITGGDPLAAIDRTLLIIRTLKEAMGREFHIHLYTTGRQASRGVLKALAVAGLDEIRFHPTSPLFLPAVRKAVEAGLVVGIEIPIAGGLVDWAKKVIETSIEQGASFVNLNEMEFVEPNALSLAQRGYRQSKRRPFAVEGSYEAALEVLSWASERGYPVHFCPSAFKDSIQTRNRFRRVAALDRAWYETPTQDGTLMWIEAEEGDGERCGELVCLPLSSHASGRKVLVEAHPTRARQRVFEQEL